MSITLSLINKPPLQLIRSLSEAQVSCFYYLLWNSSTSCLFWTVCISSNKSPGNYKHPRFSAMIFYCGKYLFFSNFLWSIRKDVSNRCTEADVKMKLHEQAFKSISTSCYVEQLCVYIDWLICRINRILFHKISSVTFNVSDSFSRHIRISSHRYLLANLRTGRCWYCYCSICTPCSLFQSPDLILLRWCQREQPTGFV